MVLMVGRVDLAKGATSFDWQQGTEIAFLSLSLGTDADPVILAKRGNIMW